MRVERAIYHDAILPEHQGNPLIEALRPKRSWEEVMEEFSNYPDYAEDIADDKNPLVRDEYLNRIEEIRQPLTDYEACFRAVERAIKKGYSVKNPLKPTTAQYLHYLVDERPDVEPRTGFFQPKGDGLTLIGESGVGKTSMIEQVLGYFPNVIEHDRYHGQTLGLRKQVVWIKVDCPSNSSVRDLCEEILSSLDLALDREKTKPAGTIGALVRQMEQCIKSSFLGMLVIDEMQNLQFKRTGGENNLLKFLHRLVNKLGIPLFFVANPPFDQTLIKELKAARRAESGYHHTMSALEKESDSWKAFIGQLWNYQWTNVYTELNDELNDTLHKLSVGNIDMASRTYREAQRLVIGSDDERITVATLESGNAVACGLSRQTAEVHKLKSTVALPSGKQRRIKQDGKIAAINIDKTGDITKPQHPEFSAQLIELVGAVDLLSRIDNPNLFQQAASMDEPIRYLRSRKVLLDDPLLELSYS
ncbi:ATP-binding protein [Vibrio parahaemolyticus]|uniref:ATP-binding protein n=1 Tax=Vibrio parahaemolyticus TaxID=670 RepID=UPI001123EAC2|nr:ATP-binding protein [Vibrio parahaemolyticus]TOI68735.1 transposase [Vibrio parahaemolyticus]HBC3606944.1 ATP-binding protein [Vibrio parahaemolyticus]HCG5472051.1 ATP-binding protein [Vibrio parahaemolyticus]HCG5933518.1 ATP-binding protein [Vibrio parahaemolyticus]HCG7638106.1 ATP-binding protein [Vibrio parahaemolyticus]